jgi:gamma-tubulin complex component 2
LIGSCLTFATFADKYSSLLEALEDEQKIGRFGVPNADISGGSTSRFESSCRYLTKMEESFSYHMKLLIEALNYYSAAETVEFLCLVVRLDYNQFHNNTVTRERSINRQRS